MAPTSAACANFETSADFRELVRRISGNSEVEGADKTSEGDTSDGTMHAEMQELAAARLTVSMPKKSVYPDAWTRELQSMPVRDLTKVLEVLGAPETATANEVHMAGTRFIAFIRRKNRVNFKAEQSKNNTGAWHGKDLSESKKIAAKVLRKRRSELRAAMRSILREAGEAY